MLPLIYIMVRRVRINDWVLCAQPQIVDRHYSIEEVKPYVDSDSTNGSGKLRILKPYQCFVSPNV